jgi:hypothetical protein
MGEQMSAHGHMTGCMLTTFARLFNDAVAREMPDLAEIYLASFRKMHAQATFDEAAQEMVFLADQRKKS